MNKKIIYTKNAPIPIGPYSQAIVVDRTLYISGQLPLDPNNMKLISENIETQTDQTIKNLKNILQEVGCNLSHLIKINIYLTNMNDFDKMNNIYKQYFTNDYPTRTTIQVSALPKNALIEIEAVAFLAN